MNINSHATKLSPIWSVRAAIVCRHVPTNPVSRGRGVCDHVLCTKTILMSAAYAASCLAPPGSAGVYARYSSSLVGAPGALPRDASPVLMTRLYKIELTEMKGFRTGDIIGQNSAVFRATALQLNEGPRGCETEVDSVRKTSQPLESFLCARRLAAKVPPKNRNIIAPKI